MVHTVGDRSQTPERSESQPRQLRIVVPVYNDWASFAILLEQLDTVAAHLPWSLTVSAIDDGSTELPEHLLPYPASFHSLERVEIIRLAVNMGHQRAIAIGLCVAAADATHDHGPDAMLVMDSDGEDPPETLPILLEQAGNRQDFAIVAARRKRVESLRFKISYLIYKSVFSLVTGKQIRFGNYSLLSAGFCERLTMVPDLWNNLAAALLRSRLPIDQVLVDRGQRYAGKSKMNFTSLIVHGLSAISVYADTIFVRLLLATFGLFLLTILTIAGTLALRLFVPAHATPGWATTVSFGMTIILLQVLFTTLTSILMLLNNRVQRLVVPAADYKIYIRGRDLLFTAANAIQPATIQPAASEAA